MASFHFPFARSTLRSLLPLVAVGAFALRLAAADAPPPPPEEPGAPVDVESESPAAPTPRVPRPSRFPQLLGIFRDVHLRAHETTEQVVTVFGDAHIDGHVEDQVVAIFGDALINQPVDGQIVVVFGNGTITHDVDGDVVWLFGNLDISPGVTIDGDFIAIGGNTQRDESVWVRGESFEFSIPGLPQFGRWVRDCLIVGRLYRHDRASTWIFVGAMLGLSLLLAALFRGPVQASVNVLARTPGLAFVNGLLAVFLIPPAIILLIATGIGLLVVPFVWVGVLFATWIGVIAVSRFCGAQLGVGANPALSLVVGHVLFAAIYAVPVIGLLTWAGVMMLGIGTATTAWLSSRRREAKANGTKPPATPPAPPSTPLAPSTAETASPFVAEAPAPRTEAVNPFTAMDPVAAPAPAAPPPPPAPTPAIAPLAAVPPPLVALERVGFVPRIWATLLDLIAVSVTLGILGLSSIFVYVWFAYHVAFWTWRGTTLGGVVMNLRIDRLDGRKLDVSVALVRAFGAVMSFVALGFGFLWAHWDPEKQSWHDKIAGTVVVRVPRGHSLI